MNTSASTTPRSRSSSRRWIWFFLLLGLFSTIAIIIPLVYNLSLQLKPEQVLEAFRRWKEKGARDYDLECAEKLDSETGEPGTRIVIYRVKVREGRMVAFARNDRVVLIDDRAGLVVGSVVSLSEREDARDFTVEGLFRAIEQRMQEDAARGGRRNYVTATFDPNDGHPIRYVHREAGKRERLEWNVRIYPIEKRE